jgi:hypothetical protein
MDLSRWWLDGGHYPWRSAGSFSVKLPPYSSTFVNSYELNIKYDTDDFKS